MLLERAYRSAALLSGFLLFFQGEALADSISGYLDLTYALSHDKLELGPLNTGTKDRIFDQRYSLTLTKNIFPNLDFSASGLFQQTNTKTTTSDGGDSDSQTRLIRPYLDLKWGAYPFGADLSYYKTRTEANASGSQKTTLTSESYQGRLEWRPADLPLLNIFLSHTNTYDEARASENVVADQVSWTSQYSQGNLNFRYYGAYLDNQDKLRNTEVTNLSNDLRTDYTKSLFNGRASFYGFYEIAHTNLDTSVGGGGGTSVNIPVFPFQGLSSLTNTPALGALDPNPFLIDNVTTASAGINIGLPPVGGDTRPRNIGLDFLAATGVNTLFVWIDRDQLPDVIANSYSWAVYTSSDNLNWTLIMQQASATFIQLSNHFEITFPDTSARYIKVVVSPLSPTVAASVPSFPDPDKIFVTEIQAFTKQTSSTNRSRSLSSTTQRVNTDLRVIILERPDLYYDVSYSLVTASAGGIRSPSVWTLSNLLGLTQPLSSIFTARATVSRQDLKNGNAEKVVNYNWNAAVDAVPLSTLSQTLTYGGSLLEQPQGSTTQHSLYLSNTAQLYTGISAYLNAGTFLTSDYTGRDNKGSTLNFGVTMSPTRKLSLTLSGNLSNSRQSGGGQPSNSTSTSSKDLALSYTPFPSVYFTADWAWQENNFVQNYQVDWSPFQGGDLQCSFYYNEVLNDQNNSKSRLIRPYLRLNLRKAGYLTLSYSIIKDSSNAATVGAIQQKSQETQEVFAVEYRLNF
ncbi:MAG TPA: hypothetical protein VFG09_10665 [Thermodesulfovibrionales bacterium]|nr:hypothetical protein [Thermodesulfovibrionales bacterium]